MSTSRNTSPSATGSEPALGPVITADGVHFTVFSSPDRVELVLFDGSDDERPARVLELERQSYSCGRYSHRFVVGIRLDISTDSVRTERLRQSAGYGSTARSCCWTATPDAWQRRLVAAEVPPVCRETISRPPSGASSWIRAPTIGKTIGRLVFPTTGRSSMRCTSKISRGTRAQGYRKSSAARSPAWCRRFPTFAISV